MQAITTKFMGATDTRGSRIKATTESGLSITVDYPHEKREGAEAHSVAAIALCKRMGWGGELIAGALKDGYVFVMADSPAWDRFDVRLTDQERESAERRLSERFANA